MSNIAVNNASESAPEAILSLAANTSVNGGHDSATLTLEREPDAFVATSQNVQAVQQGGSLASITEAFSAAPIIEIGGGNVVDLADQGWEALSRYNNPPKLFTNSSGVVHVCRATVSGKLTTPLLSREDFTYHVNKSAQWAENGQRTRVPPAVARHMWVEPDKTLPVIKGTRPFPLLHEDGTLHQARGYDPVTNLYFEPTPGLTIPEIPVRPTPEEVAAAVGLIDELFCDFPFVGERGTSPDRAHAFAFMITPLIRHLIDGPVPLFHVDAPSAETGKTLLARSALLAACGDDLPMTMEMSNKGDYRKLLTTLLPMNPLAIVLDNVNTTIQSPALLATLTAKTVQDRPIGTSKLVEMEVGAVFAMTGNNLIVDAELKRRTVRIRLNAEAITPLRRRTRNFRHPNLIEWGMENRGRLIAAAMVIAKNWIVSGKPLPEGLIRLGSFERFCETVGGMLHAAGITGFLGNVTEVTENPDEMLGQVYRFLRAWESAHQSREVTASDLLPLLVGRRAVADLGIGNGSDHQRLTRFGLKLRQLAGRAFDGYQVVRVGVSHHTVVYRLDICTRTQDAGEPSPAADSSQPRGTLQ